MSAIGTLLTLSTTHTLYVLAPDPPDGALRLTVIAPDESKPPSVELTAPAQQASPAGRNFTYVDESQELQESANVTSCEVVSYRMPSEGEPTDTPLVVPYVWSHV